MSADNDDSGKKNGGKPLHTKPLHPKPLHPIERPFFYDVPPPPLWGTPEERAQRDQEHREHIRRHYVEQFAGSCVIASIKSGKQMTPAEAVKLANDMADELGM